MNDIERAGWMMPPGGVRRGRTRPPPLLYSAARPHRGSLMKTRTLIAALALALPLMAAAEERGAGHVGLVLSNDDYPDEAFEAGREDGGSTMAPGVTLKYVYKPQRFPLVGIGLAHWRSELDGDCCGFEDATLEPTFTSIDLLVGSRTTSGDVREVWYFFAGATSVDMQGDFDVTSAGIEEGRQGAAQFGLGFFAGPPGGFSGGFELRRTRLDDFAMTHLQLSLGYGF